LNPVQEQFGPRQQAVDLPKYDGGRGVRAVAAGAKQAIAAAPLPMAAMTSTVFSMLIRLVPRPIRSESPVGWAPAARPDILPMSSTRRQEVREGWGFGGRKCERVGGLAAGVDLDLDD
jgi:hypothetical protein